MHPSQELSSETNALTYSNNAICDIINACCMHIYAPFAGFKKEQVFQPLCVHLSNNREDLINVITFYTGNTLLTLNSLVCVYNDLQVGQCQVHCVQKCLSSACDIKLSDSIKNVKKN